MKYWFGIISLLFSSNLLAQEVQWASELISFSSQYDKSEYSAKQVLGPPNKYPSWGKSPVAWAPKNKDSGSEYVRVKFATPIHVRQVLIAETFNPGAVTKIFLYDEKGNGHKIYDNDIPRSNFGQSRMFGQKIARTPYKVTQMKLVLSPKGIGGMPQIDAIGISESTQKVNLKVNALEYASTVLPPQKLSYNVNSEFAERLPIISPNGQTLYFARKWHYDNVGTDNQDDIWISHRQANDAWSKAINPGAPLNTASHNFVCAVSPDGKTLYLGNDYGSKKDGISISQLRNGSWSKPEALKIINHYNRNAFVSYHVSVDGKVMLMTVERDDGLGDRDIYVSFQYSDGDWSEPKNLGQKINTSGMEASVFIAADMKTIYFSSDGHRGYGGLDVFMSKRQDFTWQSWSEPVNLGPMINSPGNDLNYTIPASGEYAYFSSDVGKADLMSDLYRIRLPKEARPEAVKIETKEIQVAGRDEPLEIIQYEAYNEPEEVPSTPSTPSKPTVKEPEKIKVIIPELTDYKELPQIEGYYPVAEETEEDADDVLEEEDYDGNDPAIIEEIKSKPDPVTTIEVNRLKEQLALLSDDLSDLETKRNVAKDKVNDVSNTDYQYETYEYKPSYEEYKSPTRKKEAIELTEDDDMFVRPEAAPYQAATKVNKVDDNPEVNALASRYASLFEDDEPSPPKTTPRPKQTPPTPKPTTTPTTRTEIDDWDVTPTSGWNAEAPPTDRRPTTSTKRPETSKPKPPKQKYDDPQVKNLEDKYAAIFEAEAPAPPTKTKAAQEKPRTQERPTANSKKPIAKEQPTAKENPAKQKPQAPKKQQPTSDGLDEFFARSTPNEETTAPEKPVTPEKPTPNNQESTGEVVTIPNTRQTEQNQSQPERPTSDGLDDFFARAPSKDQAIAKEEPIEREPVDAKEETPPTAEPNPTVEETIALLEPESDEKTTDEAAPTLDTPQAEQSQSQPEQPITEEEGVEEEPTFEELKGKIRRELENELRNEVKEDLQEELLADVRQDLEKDLSADVKKKLENDLRNDVENQLKADMKEEVEDQLKDDLKQDVESQLRDDLKGDVEDELRDKLRADIEKELRDNMKDDVENQLRDELRDPLKEQIRQEMEYRLKKELEQKLRRELEQTIRRQLKEQQRDQQLAQQNQQGSQADKNNPDSPEGEYRTLEKDIMLYPIKEGQIIPLNNIYFDANKSTLKEASNAELQRAFAFLDSNPNLIVEISGHTNGLCTHDFAKELSKERSMAVASFLTENGIPTNRLTFKGYGKTVPIASNETSAGRKKNQRVEMKILEIIK